MKKQELLKLIEDLTKRVEELERTTFRISNTPIPCGPFPPNTYPADHNAKDCGCAINTVCNNTACPRKYNFNSITYDRRGIAIVDRTETENFSDSLSSKELNTIMGDNKGII